MRSQTEVCGKPARNFETAAPIARSGCKQAAIGNAHFLPAMVRIKLPGVERKPPDCARIMTPAIRNP